MLDYDGGPNHAGNLCDSPILADEVNYSILYCSVTIYSSITLYGVM